MQKNFWDTKSYKLDITDITGSEEYERIMQELSDELESEGITTIPEMHFIFILSGDSAYIEDDDLASSAKKSQIVKTATTLPQEELEKIASRLKQPYESGDIIVLAWPSAGIVDDLYTALGEESTYVDPYEMLSDDLAQEDTYPEFYAIAKRYNGNSAHYFTYLLPGSKTLLVHEIAENLSNDVSGDSSIEDDGSISEEYRGLRGAYIFQARRYAAFLRWAANIDSEMEKQKAYVQSSSLIRSVADPSTNLFDYSAQRETANFDCYKANYKWQFGGKHSYSYSSQVSETIYSFHNFVDRKDYFVVQSDAHVKPDFDKKTENGNVYTFGSIGWYSFRHSLPKDSPVGGGALSSYSLFKNMPKNVNRSTTLSDNISHSTSDTVGMSTGAKLGSKFGFSGENLTGELSGELSKEQSTSTTKGMSYGNSKTWTTTEWSLINECDSTNAKWKVDFYNPITDDDGEPLGYYPDKKGDVLEASKNRVDYHSEWMWQVSDVKLTDEFGEPFNKLAMEVFFECLINNTEYVDSWYRHYSAWGSNLDMKYMILRIPPHVVITSGAGPHNFGKEGANNVVFRFMCSGNWTITSSNPDWCYVSENQSKGGDTNAEENPIMFFVEPFTTQTEKAETREAVLILRNTDTNQIQSVRVVQSNR